MVILGVWASLGSSRTRRFFMTVAAGVVRLAALQFEPLEFIVLAYFRKRVKSAIRHSIPRSSVSGQRGRDRDEAPFDLKYDGRIGHAVPTWTRVITATNVAYGGIWRW